MTEKTLTDNPPGHCTYISCLYSKFHIISQHEFIDISTEFAVVEENLPEKKTQKIAIKIL